MPIFSKPNLIFIHIPKTGGTSFIKKIEGTNTRCSDYTSITSPHKDHPVSHKTYLQYKYDLKNIINNYKIISMVRNPYTRLVSYYKMHLRASNLSEIEKANGLNFYDEKFNFYIKKILIEKKLNLIERNSLSNKPTIAHLTQTDYLINEEGIIEDKILIHKLEDIGNELPRTNISNNLNFKIFYRSKENLEIIKTYFYKDFINFNYSFKLPK